MENKDSNTNPKIRSYQLSYVYEDIYISLPEEKKYVSRFPHI